MNPFRASTIVFAYPKFKFRPWMKRRRRRENMQIKAGTQSVTSGRFAAWTTATGAAVTITSATAGAVFWYKRAGGAKTPISISDLATEDAAYSSGGIKVIGGAVHRIDLPNAAFVAGSTSVEVGGEATGISIDGMVFGLIGQANSATDVTHVQGVLAGLTSKMDAEVVTIEGVDATDALQTAAAAAITAAGLATAAQVAAIDGAGGIYTQTVTVHDALGADVPNARVEIWSGAVLVSSKTTSSTGVALPSCNVGAFTLKVLASGYSDYSAALTVAGNATVGTIVLSAISITPSTTGHVTGHWTCYGIDGLIEAGTTHYLQVQEGAGTAGLSLDGTKRTAVSGVDGVVQFTGIPWGASVRVWRGTSKPQGPFIAPASGTTWAMGEVVGSP